MCIRDRSLHRPSLRPFLHSVDSIRGFAHAACFAAARRCLRFLVDNNFYIVIIITVIVCFNECFPGVSGLAGSSQSILPEVEESLWG